MANKSKKKEDKGNTPSKVDEDKKEEEEEWVSPIEAKLRQKKPLPSVQELLIHGAPEDEGKEPETFLQSLILPGALLMIFVISLVIFHNAPHHLSNHRSYQLPKRGRPMTQQQHTHEQKPPEPKRVPEGTADGNEL